jgi:hypothetical protein
MKWFDRWFYRKARWALNRADTEYPELKAEQDFLDDYSLRNRENDVPKDLCVTSDDEELELGQHNPIRFRVAHGEGGMIVETSKWNDKKAETDRRIYLIPDDVEDIAGRIGQIVTMEFFR